MDKNKQQTSVDWLVEQLKSQHNIDIERLAVTDKAKNIEKQQIMNAFEEGGNWDFYDSPRSETYYNETYGTE